MKTLSVCDTYDKIKANNISLYDEIIDNWSVEAKKENLAYFYNINEVNAIISGKKSFVIGRKGSGKTAIAQYLCAIVQNDIFCHKLSFKNFPFNILYSLENHKDYTEPNQYISIWKFLIYSCICKKMIQNNNINSEVQEKLIKIYGDDPLQSLERVIPKWTSKEFGAEVLGVGFNYSGDYRDTDFTWLDAIEVLETVILNYCDSSCYYIVFDELDEDYKDFSNEVEERKYKCMLTSLFKAIQNIRNVFDVANKHIYPVAFLRSDIYAQLTDSDKNKWRESIIDLEWDTTKIKYMLAHRLCVALNVEDVSFDMVWTKVFSKEKVKMGNRQSRQMSIYDYIERSTEMRPRDFIQYIKECAIIAREKNEKVISPKTVKAADENFSEYLKGETIDELFAVLPEIDEILGLFSTIRKQRFQFDVFRLHYDSLVNQEKIPKRNVEWVLLKLFDAGVIGNAPTMKGQTIFKFSKKMPRFNFNETMIIHRGLFKALQIY